MRRGSLTHTTGSVSLQLNALEVITRYSMNTARATSVLSSLHDFRVQEAEQSSSKEWNWKYLRDQFDQKDLEGLYRRYDDKLKESLIYIYISILVCFSALHITLVVVSTYSELVQWHSTYLSLAMFILRISIPTIFLWKGVYETMKKKCFWMPIFVTFIITVDLVATDVIITIYSSVEGVALRPAYATIALLSLYIFLPMRNNFIAILFGLFVSISYVFILAFFTYIDDPEIAVVVSSDIIYLIGVNLMGTYFRLMNEIVTRRSFLDRRACVESTLRLKFVKDQEERLMLSILPEHIASRVRKDIRDIFLGLTHETKLGMKSFSNLYVEEHENVSILYADVVNYTMISTTLSPLRMVELLNELFGRFDEASEEHDVLRIKFLGDCYYCVCGIPKPNPQHAKSCVDLGLEMIHIIKDVREKRSLNIDMRIGVHSGKVLSGLVGIRKWQFDIWSKDATIASKMESTGKPGKVHVTQSTLELILDNAREYIIEPDFESQSDPFIAKHKLETYLLTRPAKYPVEYKPFRRASVGFTKIIKKTNISSRRSEHRSSTIMGRSTTFMDDNLVEYRQMLKAADAQMAKEIEDMSHGKEYLKKESKLNRWTLMYKNFKLEKTYNLMPDLLFKYYITCCLIIFILTSLINGLTTNWFQGFQWYAWLIFAILLTVLLVMQPLTWFQFLWIKHKGIEEPRNRFLRWCYDASAHIIKSFKLRTLIYIVISVGLAASSVVNVIGCTEVTVVGSETVLSNCVSPWHVTQCWSLALLLNFLFSRVFFVFKWIVAGGMTIFYLSVVWEVKSALFSQDTTWNVGLDPRISHTLSVLFITFTLYFIDRTTEYRNRLDHLWQMQLKEEEGEAETMLKVNNMLLENILPAHVVQIYLDLNRPIDELYYEKYDNVAVMFASLTDYKIGNESDTNDKLMLSILNEVISDFDRLLLTGTSQHKVEKIKMAGWTYMAACGLDPSRRESFDSTSYTSVVDRRQNTPYNRAIVLTMVEFAAAMMMQLQTFNRGSFQSFEGLNLRIGMSNGEVAAGVVGSLKPLYDIWGHAVNMASRMDSTGETGKIQVTENTALILDECGILTNYRGKTFVKGAGYIRTYFVPLDENFKLVKKENSSEYYKNEYKDRYQNINDYLNEMSLEITSDNEDIEVASEDSVFGVRDLSLDYDDLDCSESVTSTQSYTSEESKVEPSVTHC